LTVLIEVEVLTKKYNYDGNRKIFFKNMYKNNEKECKGKKTKKNTIMTKKKL
jgi:hypothetical protein